MFTAGKLIKDKLILECFDSVKKNLQEITIQAKNDAFGLRLPGENQFNNVLLAHY